jgi:hypothetical protein
MFLRRDSSFERLRPVRYHVERRRRIRDRYGEEHAFAVVSLTQELFAFLSGRSLGMRELLLQPFKPFRTFGRCPLGFLRMPEGDLIFKPALLP